MIASWGLEAVQQFGGIGSVTEERERANIVYHIIHGIGIPYNLNY